MFYFFTFLITIVDDLVLVVGDVVPWVFVVEDVVLDVGGATTLEKSTGTLSFLSRSALMASKASQTSLGRLGKGGR